LGKISEKSEICSPRYRGSNFGGVDKYYNIWPCLACHISAGNRDIPILFLHLIDYRYVYKFTKLQGVRWKMSPAEKVKLAPSYLYRPRFWKYKVFSRPY